VDEPHPMGVEVDQVGQMVQRGGGQVVDHPDRRAQVQQRVDEVPPDEPGAASHAHGSPFESRADGGDEVGGKAHRETIYHTA